MKKKSLFKEKSKEEPLKIPEVPEMSILPEPPPEIVYPVKLIFE